MIQAETSSLFGEDPLPCELLEGDCLDHLRAMPADSFSAVVTDPPYGLGFMGRDWDKALPDPAIWVEVLRVLKPGGHALIFGGSRTFHRLACQVEDAGMELRDSLLWLYGSGFPKSLDVSKAIDRQRNDRKRVRVVCRRVRAAMDELDLKSKDLAALFGNCHPRLIDHWAARDSDSQPSLPRWDQWERLRDRLKLGDELDAEVWALNGRKGQPGENWAKREKVGEVSMSDSSSRRFAVSTSAHDCAVQERLVDLTRPATDAAKRWEGYGTALKPAFEPIILARKPLAGTVADNCQEYGTGALNVDGCRVGEESVQVNTYAGRGPFGKTQAAQEYESRATKGRWPSNVILDEEAGAALDAQAGERPSGAMRADLQRSSDGASSSGWLGDLGGPATRKEIEASSGGASRFFYCAKASRADRGPGNDHPTVKPQALMRWLVRLVTMPEGNRILDPFAGSGTTGLACLDERVPFLGIERDPHNFETAQRRIARARQIQS